MDWTLQNVAILVTLCLSVFNLVKWLDESRYRRPKFKLRLSMQWKWSQDDTEPLKSRREESMRSKKELRGIATSELRSKESWDLIAQCYNVGIVEANMKERRFEIKQKGKKRWVKLSGVSPVLEYSGRDALSPHDDRATPCAAAPLLADMQKLGYHQNVKLRFTLTDAHLETFKSNCLKFNLDDVASRIRKTYQGL